MAVRARTWAWGGRLLLLGFLLAAACVRPTGPDGKPIPEEPIPPSLDPIVFKNPGAAAGGDAQETMRDGRPVSEEEQGFADKLRLAQGYAAGGFDAEALEVIRAALSTGPPPGWRTRFEDLRGSLHARRVETEVLRADARGEHDYVSFAADCDFVVRIRNVSAGALSLAAGGEGPGARSPAALHLSMERRDLDIYGAELRRTWSQVVPLAREGGPGVDLPAGGARDVRVRVPAADVGEAISGLRILTLGGRLRALAVEPGGGETTIGLEIRPGRVVALPEGYGPLAADPLGGLGRAVAAVLPAHVLVAAEFVGIEDAIRAVEILAAALAEADPALETACVGAVGLLAERSAGREAAPFAAPLVRALEATPERADALRAALARATGENLPPDARLWVDWHRRAEGSRLPLGGVRAPPSAVPAGEPR